ncbi:hypothetical protein [Acetivibrio ethanolgignens]|uniref:Uncharacterized protein n=1 Tax=Acetivibrio ethanolgignens TaxID=290052 RepID=A0A0V8QEQ2_9FIRM|nr:hypothetical protein [Acetivibrio ethanolgignens]KSV59073.1 hypothetical protein ASU35_01790 [Acetivibrio ethanolgignens]
MEKCANCNGELRLSADRKKLVCEYCDSEFYINENDTGGGSTRHSEESLALQLLDTSAIKTFDNDHGLKSFQELCAWINAGDTVETCLEGLKDLAKQHTDWAMDGVNTDLLNKAKKQIGNQLSLDEQILFFKDSGIIATGKSGVLITNKTLYIFSKKNVRKLAIADIYSIHALALVLGNGKWYFNANKDLEIDNIACSPTEHGLIMALVCLLVREYRGYGYKIKVYKGVL